MSSQVTAPPSEKQIRDRLVKEVAAAARVPAESVEVQEPFASYDISSVEAVQLVAVLETWLGLELDATLLWDHSTIEALARHLAQVVKNVDSSGVNLPVGPGIVPAKEGGEFGWVEDDFFAVWLSS